MISLHFFSNKTLVSAERLQHLFTITRNITDDNFRNSLIRKLDRIQESTEQLSLVVADTLLLSEELLSRYYQLKFRYQLKSKLATESPEKKLFAISEINEMDWFEGFLVAPQKGRSELIELLLSKIEADKKTDPVSHFLTFVRQNDEQLRTNEARKQFLLISVRIQSEQLSQYVNEFTQRISEQIYQQQLMAKKLNNQVFWGMIIVMVLLIVTVVTNYGRNLRVIQELTSVTDDMIRLSTGNTNKESRFQIRNDEVGELLRAYLTFRRHTEQIESVRDDLEQQKLLLETVFNGMYDGLSVFSSDNRLLAWNKRYLSSLNLSEQRIYRGMTLEEILKLISSDGEIYRDISGNPIDFSRWISVRHTQDACVERHDKYGGIIEFRSQPMPNGGFITLTQDLTYRRETELQLQQAKKMEVLGQLTGGVSHDFNNFLTSISGNLQLLEIQPELTQQSQKYVARAIKATDSGSHLIRKLLAFSRKQVLEPELVVVEDVIQDTADLLEYSVSEDIDLVFTLSQKQSYIRIDRIQLQNALLNLTLNANGAIEGRGTITLATNLVEQEGKPWLEISVTDTGKGIPKAVQSRVFEAFFTTKAVGEGSGLGLSSVHGYVQQSGGDIGIESEVNQGTRIWMRWPVQSDSLTFYPDTDKKELDEFMPGILLLVEDDRQVALTMIDLLGQYSEQVVHFLSADKALEWLSDYHQKVGGILSDVHLAHSMSGIEFRDKVTHDYPLVPIFLYSGMAREMIEQQFNCTLEENFIPKPITKNAISQLVNAGKNNEK